jgi:hypothetical protein
VKWRSSLHTFQSHFLLSKGYEVTVAGTSLSNPSFTDSLAGHIESLIVEETE